MAAGQTRGRVRNPAMYKARAMQMLDAKIKGKSIKDIAEQWGLSRDTVERSLDWAVKQGLTSHYESQILSDLVPLAMGIYKKQLEAGDPFVAKDIMDKMTKLGDRFDRRESSQEQAGLGAYLAEKRMALMAGKKGDTFDGATGNYDSTGQPDIAATTVAAGFVSTYLDDLAGDDADEVVDTDSSVGEAGGGTPLGQIGPVPDEWQDDPNTIVIAVESNGAPVNGDVE